MRVGRRYKFRAQHHVPDLPEPWGSPHWHDYTVEFVHVGTPVDGLLVDHEDLDAQWGRWVEELDGADLNELFKDTTVESLAMAIRKAFEVDEVTVWEDDDRWATA